MILSDIEILKEIEKGNIFIEPFDKKRLNPNSYNLRLDRKIVAYNDIVLDPKVNNSSYEFEITNNIVLYPGELYLAQTMEWTETFGLVPCLEGRSSLGRLGLNIHICAGFGDNGFCGKWTLELSVVRALRLYPEMEICQIFYQELKSPGSRYKGKYQNQKRPTECRFYQE